jgi:hypothetical protein
MPAGYESGSHASYFRYGLQLHQLKLRSVIINYFYSSDILGVCSRSLASTLATCWKQPQSAMPARPGPATVVITSGASHRCHGMHNFLVPPIPNCIAAYPQLPSPLRASHALRWVVALFELATRKLENIYI